MGQKRIKLVDLTQNTKSSKAGQKRNIIKSGKTQGRLTDMASATLVEAEEIKKKETKELKKLEKAIKTDLKEEKKVTKTARKKKLRSRRYRQLRTKIDRKKLYPIAEAIKILCQITNSKIDETVEIHLVSHEDKLSSAVRLPHGTGKKQKIVIADDKVIDTISKGKIDFDILIASPQMMSKIAKVAKILGPKGLMPNPKAGTISDKPEELKKKLEGGEVRFKTETKTPLIHFCLGKISFGEKKLAENLKAFLEAVKVKNIKKAVLTSTQSPGIKLDIKQSLS
ncbi:MAG TPA: hypothetical protein VMW29_03445 [Candidatus Bathyarchaeia archaeon]|nr:hypothetical protein [Candidatus Bathyarchaeia archaeon]